MNVVGKVSKVKYNADGSVQNYNARLVAKGFYQKLEFNFFKTFSSVIKSTTISIILTLALAYEWLFCQLDFTNAFLNGTLHEIVFMQQSEG